MIIDVLTFRAAEGVTTEQVAAADAELQVRFALLQPGIVRWTTARADDGEWLVVSLWDSFGAAEAAEVAAPETVAGRELAALVDPATVRRRRYADVGG